MSAPTRWPNDIGRGEPRPLTEDDLDRHIASLGPGRYLHTRPDAERSHIAGQAAQRWNVMAAERAASADWCDTVPTQPAPMAAEAATSVGADQDDAPKPQMHPMEAVGLVIAYAVCGVTVSAAFVALVRVVGQLLAGLL